MVYYSSCYGTQIEQDRIISGQKLLLILVIGGDSSGADVGIRPLTEGVVCAGNLLPVHPHHKEPRVRSPLLTSRRATNSSAHSDNPSKTTD